MAAGLYAVPGEGFLIYLNDAFAADQLAAAHGLDIFAQVPRSIQQGAFVSDIAPASGWFKNNKVLAHVISPQAVSLEGQAFTHFCRHCSVVWHWLNV